MNAPTRAPARFAEFVALVAFMFSLVALSIDAVLPALPMLGESLEVRPENRRQLVISALFLGLAVGQLLYGSLSDAIGRKPAIQLGLAVFITGSLLSAFAHDFTTMLIGRALQGLGAAGPRIVTVAMVRDRFAGEAMARVMSIAMACFILVPALAPALGLLVLKVATWPAIFGLFALLAVVGSAWLALRHAETLPPSARRTLSPTGVLADARHVLGNRQCVGYMLSAGALFGAFIGYLSSAQQIFQSLYRVGDAFPLYFGTLALAIGAAAIVNSRLVMRLGMRRLTSRAFIGLIMLAVVFMPVVVGFDGRPPIALTMMVLLACFFCFGVLFGNINALALEPMSERAGSAASLVGAVSTALSLPLGTWVGQSYDGSVLPLFAGIAGFGGAALLAARWANRPRGDISPLASTADHTQARAHPTDTHDGSQR